MEIADPLLTSLRVQGEDLEVLLLEGKTNVSTPPPTIHHDEDIERTSETAIVTAAIAIEVIMMMSLRRRLEDEDDVERKRGIGRIVDVMEMGLEGNQGGDSMIKQLYHSIVNDNGKGYH